MISSLCFLRNSILGTATSPQIHDSLEYQVSLFIISLNMTSCTSEDPKGLYFAVQGSSPYNCVHCHGLTFQRFSQLLLSPYYICRYLGSLYLHILCKQLDDICKHLMYILLNPYWLALPGSYRLFWGPIINIDNFFSEHCSVSALSCGCEFVVVIPMAHHNYSF